ncbi:MAG: transposase [Proteobacteria bacterium]|nr:transposase [Pseudomonadota bacterium]
MRGQAYFVTACCYERKFVFRNTAAAKLMMRELWQQGSQGDCQSLAFVVMPDHIHWLLQLTGETTLSDIVGRTKGRTAYLIARSTDVCGRIWQSGFHDHALRAEEDIERVGNYLIHNPVRAGIVSDVDQYSYWDSIWHRRFLPKGDK